MCAGHQALGRFGRGTLLQLDVGKGRCRQPQRAVREWHICSTGTWRAQTPPCQQHQGVPERIGSLTSPGGCSAVWTGKVTSYQLLQDEIMRKHLISLSCHRPNSFNITPNTVVYVCCQFYNPSQKLSTTQLFTVPTQWDGEENWKKVKTHGLR